MLILSLAYNYLFMQLSKKIIINKLQYISKVLSNQPDLFKGPQTPKRT